MFENNEVGYDSNGCSVSDECGEVETSVTCAGMDEAKMSVLPHHILSCVAIEKLIPPDSEFGMNDIMVIARWSRFTRGLRVLGWLLRFLHNCTVPEAQHRQGELSFAELSDAKIRLLQYVQILSSVKNG